MNISGQISVLVVEDHAIVRDGLVALLSLQPDLVVIGEAGDGQQAVQQHRLHRPDVTLMDLQMPGLGGIEAIRQIRFEAPEACILVLTSYSGDADIQNALRAGARSYLLKEVSSEELVEQIRRAARGSTRLPREVAQKLEEAQGFESLTQREMDVLRGIAEGLSNKEIAERHEITEGTVKSHVSSVLGKLAANDRTQAAMTALRRGLLHLETERN